MAAVASKLQLITAVIYNLNIVTEHSQFCYITDTSILYTKIVNSSLVVLIENLEIVQ